MKCKACNSDTEGRKHYCNDSCREVYHLSGRISPPVSSDAKDLLILDLQNAVEVFATRQEVLWRVVPQSVKEMMRRIENKYPIALPSDYMLIKKEEDMYCE